VAGNSILVYFLQKHVYTQKTKQNNGDIPMINRIKYINKREHTYVNK